MSFMDFINKDIMEGFSIETPSITKIWVTLIFAFFIAMYIHLVYRFVTKNAFYQKNFGVSMTIISIITAGIIISMQSSLVISLGMVGALSIVRFRTAIKDPMDLLFLFWSIGNGIICGAGLYEIAVIMSIAATVGIIIFEFIPVKKSMFLLVINTSDLSCEDKIIDLLKSNCKVFKVRSKCVNRQGMDLIIEVRPGKNSNIVSSLLEFQEVKSASLLENNDSVV